MKNLSQVTIVINTETKAKLDSLNAASAQVDDPLTHHMWCSSALPFQSSISAFIPGDEPIVSWTALCLNGDFLGQIELHNNRFGWILARLWVNKEWRRIGLARNLWLTALDYAFTRTDVVGAFCDTRNEASRNLQTSTGFRPIKLWADAKCELLSVSKEDYETYKWAIKPLNLQKPAPVTVSNLLHCDPSIPARP